MVRCRQWNRKKIEDNAGGDIDYTNLDLKQFLIANGIPEENLLSGPFIIKQNDDALLQFRTKINASTISETKKLFYRALKIDTGVDINITNERNYLCQLCIYTRKARFPYTPSIGADSKFIFEFDPRYLTNAQNELAIEEGSYCALAVGRGGIYKFASKAFLEENIIYYSE